MPATCTRCRAELEPHELEGLCPRCLLQGVKLEPIDPVPTTPPGRFVAPAPAQLAPLFPQLEVLELLGQGGMGAVYKARQVKLDRLVALKVLPPEAADGPGFAERFTREARALARLNHPHIVAVHDFGEVGGLYYLVMEYVDGVNLRQALNEGKLSPQQALPLVAELCSALQYAHEMGVVHRDIKPENVLLDRQGRVKVADFGLAKLVGATQATSRLTGTRQAMGTPHYMAPEQLERPLEVDHRADIYSLGVVFYELLTGELPLGKFAPPSAKAAVDARLDGVVLRAIEKEPEQRYQQMSEMRSAVVAVEQPPEEGAEKVAAKKEPGGGAQLRRELDVLATLGMAALAGAVWAALVLGWPYLAQDKLRSYGFYAIWIFLPWGFAPGNRYVKRLWAVATLTLCASGVWCELVGAVHPLGLDGCLAWAVCLIFGPWAVSAFVDSFKPGESGVDETEGEDDEDEPVAGLTANEEALRRLLNGAVSDFHHLLAALPEIESEALAAARKSCQVAPDDRVIGILDLACDDWQSTVVFGCQALYWRNPAGTPHPGGGTMTYGELAGRRAVNHGDAVYLGREQYVCPNEEETGITGEQLAWLLDRAGEAMAPRREGAGGT